MIYRIKTDFVKIALSFCLLLLIYFYLSIIHYQIPIDDAFITFRYAHNFVEGMGLNFNKTEYVEGFSNFLWLLHFIIFDKIFSDPLLTSKILNFFYGALILFLFFKSFSNRKSGLTMLFLACLTLICHSGFLFFTTSGMETLFGATLVLIIFFNFLRENNRFAQITLSLLPLIHPFFYSFILSYFFFNLILIFYKVNPGERLHPLKRNLLLLLPVFIYEIFRIAYFKALLPNTFSAKVGIDPIINLYEGTHYFLNSFCDPVVLLLFVFFLTTLFIYKGEKFIFLLSLLFSTLIFIFYTGKDWMPYSRYIFISYPLFLYIFFDFITKERTERVKTLLNRKFFHLPIFLILIVINLFFADTKSAFAIHSGFYTLFESLSNNIKYGNNFFSDKYSLWKKKTPYKELSEELLKLIPFSSSIAVVVAGEIPFKTSLFAIDLLGLTCNSLIPSKSDREKLAALIGYKPDYLLLYSKGGIYPSFAANILPAYEKLVVFEHCYSGPRIYKSKQVLFARKELIAQQKKKVDFKTPVKLIYDYSGFSRQRESCD